MNRTTFSFERFSLTPTLSQRERENNRPIVGNVERLLRFKGSMRENLLGEFFQDCQSGFGGEE
jgi:hypothetical protein